MTYYLRRGAEYTVTSKASLDIHEQLPAGTYTVKYDEMRDIYSLEMVEDMEVSGKIYGDTHRNADRILNTFADRPNSTGVMLSGEKGSGKTLLAKMLSVKGREHGLPTIVINQPWHGDTFNTFMQMIEQPTIVVFDEFEKVYDNEQQEKLLTLLDGVYASKKLFVITTNDKYKVNSHMKNRPGRIYYRLEYAGLEKSFIIEYCEDNLINKEHIDALCRMAMIFSEFNFDMLKAMVEEMNRYDETPQQVMRVLNAKPESDGDSEYAIVFSQNGKVVPDSRMYSMTWSGNPLASGISFYYYLEKKPKADDGSGLFDEDDGLKKTKFETSDLHSLDSANNKLLFENRKGERVELTRITKHAYNWDAY